MFFFKKGHPNQKGGCSDTPHWIHPWWQLLVAHAPSLRGLAFRPYSGSLKNIAASAHVSRYVSRETFGGWGFAPDPECGAHVASHTFSFLYNVVFSVSYTDILIVYV